LRGNRIVCTPEKAHMSSAACVIRGGGEDNPNIGAL